MTPWTRDFCLQAIAWLCAIALCWAALELRGAVP